MFQLLLVVDACRRAAAGRITAIVPYLDYARADKRHKRREAIAASMVANLLQTADLPSGDPKSKIRNHRTL